jgi:hypothetical protein
MAAKTTNVEVFFEDQIQRYNVEISVNCGNCALMEKQHHSALLVLKSAETIISLLREDIKNTSHALTADLQFPASTCETSGYEQTSEKWIPVMSNTSKMKKLCASSTMNMQQQYVSPNGFAPLFTLIKSQQEKMEHTSKCELPQYTQFPMKTTSQHSVGSKIPTIVNGRLIYSVSKKPIKKTSKQLRIPILGSGILVVYI